MQRSNLGKLTDQVLEVVLDQETAARLAFANMLNGDVQSAFDKARAFIPIEIRVKDDLRKLNADSDGGVYTPDMVLTWVKGPGSLPFPRNTVSLNLYLRRDYLRTHPEGLEVTKEGFKVVVRYSNYGAW